MGKHKCLECNEDCKIVEETFDYSATHCAPNGGIHKTGFYTSDCCDAEFLTYDERDMEDDY